MAIIFQLSSRESLAKARFAMLTSLKRNKLKFVNSSEFLAKARQANLAIDVNPFFSKL